MSKYELSILIPSLKEEFLKETVEDILKNKRGKTEIIVGFDGEWPEVPLADHPDLRVIHSSKNLGQRGMTNLLCKLSEAKWVAKTDAHCAFDEGFDVKLLKAVEGHDDWTIVPAMKNLHAFNWVCKNCETEFYQGEKPDKCPDEMCQFIESEWEKKIYFIPRDMSDFKKRRGPTSTAYRFTPDNLQFKYFGKLQNHQTEETAETMSLQGSFFMLTRAKYWELNICDETWGGWGQQGTEVALKTWLSGGRVIVHRDTWYAHMFRTNNQIAFPWNKGLKESQGQQQQRARKACVDLFKNNKWDKQVRSLGWLIERFWKPLQEEPSDTDKADRKWTQEDLKRVSWDYVPSKGIIYYTDNQLNLKLAKKVQKQIKSIELPIVSASLKPMDNMGSNYHVKMERGYEAYFKQILTALENSEADIIYFCEHDVLYHPSHFEFTPPRKDKFYFNHNWWSVREDGFAVHWDANRVSQLCGYREHLVKFYRNRIKEIERKGFDRSYEPGRREKRHYEVWKSPYPNIDIRHKGTMTGDKWSADDFRDKSTCVNWQETDVEHIPGWDGIL